MKTLAHHNRLAARFRLVVIAVGLLATASVFSVAPLLGGTGAFILVLCGLAMMTERYPLELPGYGVVSGLESTVLAALFLGEVGAALAVLLAGLLTRAYRRGVNSRLSFFLYSYFQVALCYLAPFVFARFLGLNHSLELAFAALVAVVADHAFAAFHLFLLQDRLGHFTTRLEWARIRLSLLALLPIGLLLACCLEQGAVATALFLVPLAVAFRGIKTYVDTLCEAREVVSSMVEAVERRELGTEGHAARVADWAGSIAREMGLREVSVRRIIAAARMHDLGKIGIEESVLNKVGTLSSEEVASLRRHPEVGAKVASHLSLGKQEAEFIYHHHENFDGSGYPMGLAGHDIPQGARILAVAEAFDSMISSPRRSGQLTPKAAMAELENAQGKQFDPSVVAAFRTVLRKRIA